MRETMNTSMMPYLKWWNIKLTIHFRVLLGTQKMRVGVILGTHWLCPGRRGTTINISYQFFIGF